MLGDMDEDDIFGERAKDSEWDGAEVFSENAAPAAAPAQPASSAFRAAPEPEISYLEEGGGGGGGSAPAAAPEEPDLPPAPRSKHWYHISHWAYLFDVNTYDVFKRMLKTFVPVGPSFWEHIGKNPDYYGPFWIALTLAFCTALTANLGGYFQAELCVNGTTTNATAVFTSNIDAAAVATGTFLGWTFVIPILFWGLFKWWTVENAHAKNLVCLYGYSLTPYLPLSFLCLIPHDYARWIVVSIGCLFNAMFLVLAIFQLLRHDHMVKAIPTCVGVLVLSLGLGLGLKLYFWQFDSC